MPEPEDDGESVYADSERADEVVRDATKVLSHDGIVRKCATAIHLSGHLK
jgi:hypothetical protein